MDLVTTGLVSDGADLIERRSQDVEPILEYAKRMRNQGDVGSSEMRHAAKIPKAVIENYINRTGITFHEFMVDDKHIRAMLNDPDLSGFRIWKGRV
ncbi:hypothetical protein [Stenotrophomonas indicatrix]|uniref:hypothetical protein n=1 Tax=Stenotrophomonas indicatrix TaxID=2045451 RepID=UPI001AA14D4B|nr:hypothetical protein [Stenotrophomonas indicatrix]MBO1748895.1 hypothetical protein [Stenotrophomonas indicatrix]